MLYAGLAEATLTAQDNKERAAAIAKAMYAATNEAELEACMEPESADKVFIKECMELAKMNKR